MTQVILSKVENFPELNHVNFAEFERPNMNERLNFEVLVSASPLDGQKKKATVGMNLPTWGNFEAICDEGMVIGGTDTAPAPLAYLNLGLAFCFLTHMTSYIKISGFEARSLRLEQKTKFSTEGANNMSNGQVNGRCDGVETVIVLDTDEPIEKTRKMISACQDACMALQTYINEVSANTRLVLNGEETRIT